MKAPETYPQTIKEKPVAKKISRKKIEQYDHSDKERVNNPPVGLVSPSSDPDRGEKRTYQYDPHLDPQLVWAGKAEHTAFDVPTVSLHVHERIDPRTIIQATERQREVRPSLLNFFAERKPLRQAIDFYKHKEGWSNRLVAGDSLLVMNSLLEKEGMAGKVQMVYFDPPYGIKYGSNFQPFVNKRDVTDGRDEDLSSEPEMIKAFRDTWELGIHSYLTYLRDRLLLARELLAESGSIFVQISDENVHHVREIMDEVFGCGNFISLITTQKTSVQTDKYLSSSCDYIIWYSKEKQNLKARNLFLPKDEKSSKASQYKYIETKDGRRIPQHNASDKDLSNDYRLFRPDNLTSSHEYSLGKEYIEFEGEQFHPGNRYWSTGPNGFEKLKSARRLIKTGKSLSYIRYLDDFPLVPLLNVWTDTTTGGGKERYYVVQTVEKVIQRCMLLSTDPGDLVFDPTCGSGTTAFVAERWGRRWITCDTSRVALTLAKQRLMTASYDYYNLAHPKEGVSSGFDYRKVPHITLQSIVNNPDIKKGMSRVEVDQVIRKHAMQETLYDQPLVDRNKSRITGPFTVEAVPAPYARSFDDLEKDPSLETADADADTSIARSGETLRQDEWREELLQTGIRAKGGRKMEFTRVEPMSGTRYIQAKGEMLSNGDKPLQTLIVFGPEHAPLEQRQVELAIEEARLLKPDILLFCAFQFDEEAAKDIDETPENLIGFKLLKAQMNADLLTDDLRKKRSSNESFWLVGQPDVKIIRLKNTSKIKVEVMGFDYYNPKTGKVESGGKNNIAMWMLDPDYDHRSLFPGQVFFPMAGAKEGWSRLARNLKAEIDEEKIAAYHGTVSLPFEPGPSIAVKIIDDRGIESLRVISTGSAKQS